MTANTCWLFVSPCDVCFEYEACGFGETFSGGVNLIEAPNRMEHSNVIPFYSKSNKQHPSSPRIAVAVADTVSESINGVDGGRWRFRQWRHYMYGVWPPHTCTM